MQRLKKFIIALLAIVLPLMFAGCQINIFGPGNAGAGNNNPGSGSGSIPSSPLPAQADASPLAKIITIYIPDSPSAADVVQMESVRAGASTAVFNILKSRYTAIVNEGLQNWLIPNFTAQTIADMLPLTGDKIGFFEEEINALIDNIKTELIGPLALNNDFDNITDNEVANEAGNAACQYLSLSANVIGGSRVYIDGAESNSMLLVKPIIDIDTYEVETVEKDMVFPSGHENMTTNEKIKEVELTITKGGVTKRYTKDNYYLMPKRQYIGVVYVLKQSSNKFLYLSGASMITLHDYDNAENAEFEFMYKAANNTDNIIDFNYNGAITMEPFEISDDMEEAAKDAGNWLELLAMKTFFESGITISFYEEEFDKGRPGENSDMWNKPSINDPGMRETEALLPKVKTGQYAAAAQVALLDVAIKSAVKINRSADLMSFTSLMTNNGIVDCLVLRITGIEGAFTIAQAGGLSLEDRFPSA